MKTRRSIRVLYIVVGLFIVQAAQAYGQAIPAGDQAEDFLVHFNIGWENSWRGELTAPDGEKTSDVFEGWDAAWLFVKYRVGGQAWQHATINTAGHLVPEGSTLIPGLSDAEAAYDPADNPIVGYFILRDGSGHGEFSAEGVRLSLNYSDNGLSPDSPLEIRLFAIEMEYIPEMSASGYVAPFYMMKNQISQQQYVDFLNTLSPDEQSLHTTTSPFEAEGTHAMNQGDANCNDIRILFSAYEMDGRNFSAEYITDEPGEPCRLIDQEAAEAFLSWSGQRTLSQQELESASNWMQFRNEKYLRLTDKNLLSGSNFDNGQAAGFRGARSDARFQIGHVNPTTRAQLNPPKR
ncbi:MAG: SUMF1/EgtB/PvdO family nonheme iron enzyme [Bacteroidales bacterium]